MSFFVCIAKLIEKHTFLEWTVLSTNLLWQKVVWIDDEILYWRIENFNRQLSALWLSPDFIWNDKNNIESLLSVLNLLNEKWLIQEKDIKVKICDCWMCESLVLLSDFMEVDFDKYYWIFSWDILLDPFSLLKEWKNLQKYLVD